MAWQWGWQYRLPGEDGKLGTTKVTNISDENPFGINIDDPFGREDLMVKKTKLFKRFKILRTFQILYKPKSTPHFNDKKFTMTELLRLNLLEDKVVEAIKLKERMTNE